MPRSISYYVELALEAVNAGFSSKAAQKRALDSVSRAWDLAKEEFLVAVRKAAPYQTFTGELTQEQWNDRGDHFAANDVPLDLHNIRDRHIELMEKVAGNGSIVCELVELRNAIKAAPIDFVAKPTASPFQIRAEKTIAEIMARRGTQYARGLDLGELFGFLPVSANVHIVHGHKGAVFFRTFYYLAGEFTPLNVIIAAAEETARRAEAA